MLSEPFDQYPWYSCHDLITHIAVKNCSGTNLLNGIKKDSWTFFSKLKIWQDPSCGLFPAGGPPLDWLTFSLPQSWLHSTLPGHSRGRAIGRCQHRRPGPLLAIPVNTSHKATTIWTWLGVTGGQPELSHAMSSRVLRTTRKKNDTRLAVD